MALASLARCAGSDSLRSSSRFEMNAVSTSIEGMSGDLSTTNPACCTRGLRTSPMRSSAFSTFSAATMLAEMLAVCDRSSSTLASTASLSSSLMPPLRSAAFSRSASQRAASLDAPRSDSTYTDEPDTSGIGDGIGVDRHEQVRLGAPRARVPLAQTDEVVAVASQHGFHAGLGVDARRQRLGDREHHVLLARAAFARSARIDAAVTRIDRDHDVAAGIERRVRGTDGHRRRREPRA